MVTKIVLVTMLLLWGGLKVSAQSEGLTKAEERMLRRLEREALRKSEIPYSATQAAKAEKKKKAKAPESTQNALMSIQQKHKHGDWYLGLGAGFSQSLAENAMSTDFIAHQTPSVNLLFGHNFNPAFGFRLTGGVNMQVSRCSEAAANAMPEVLGN